MSKTLLDVLPCLQHQHIRPNLLLPLMQLLPLNILAGCVVRMLTPSFSGILQCIDKIEDVVGMGIIVHYVSRLELLYCIYVYLLMALALVVTCMCRVIIISLNIEVAVVEATM